MSLEHHHSILNTSTFDKTMLMFMNMFGSNSGEGAVEELRHQLLVGVVEGEGSGSRGMSRGGVVVAGVLALGDEGENAMVEVGGGVCH